MIGDVGNWVLRTACREAASWPNSHRVAVNISPLQLADDSLPGIVAQALEDSGLPAARLELELTESALLADLDQAQHMLPALKAEGISLALDDFGTGYSSLAVLRDLPFDKLKLDKSFTDGITSSRQAQAVIRAVVALGQALDMVVLAEGVETQEELDFLIAEGCAEVQGYLLGRPAPMPLSVQAPAATAAEIQLALA